VKEAILLLLMEGGVVLAGCCLFLVLRCPAKEVNHCKFEKLTPGMTVEDVTAIFGSPASEIPSDRVPENSSGMPVVSGERYFQWHGSVNMITVIIGTNNDALVDKWY
jgi:hypothetical protein